MHDNDNTPSAADTPDPSPTAPLGPTFRSGSVLLRGKMIPHSNAGANLLATSEDTDWLHGDPWRVLRIQSEFVDGFNALAKLGPAVSIYGSARNSRQTSSPLSASASSGTTATSPLQWRS